jgi:hypothetical protein
MLAIFPRNLKGVLIPMNSMTHSPRQAIKPVPHCLVLILCWLFAILYGVWILPETVFIRHFCLVVGAVFSLYVIYPNRALLFKKEAIPIWLIILLMIWVTFHLFFIGQNFDRQWREYTTIWKKIAIGSVFAIGLGFALISQVNNQKHTNQYWRIIYFGFLLPAITYFVKYSATKLGYHYGLDVPIYLVLDPDHMGSRFGISRAWYVFFCLPSVALSIGYIAMLFKNGQFSIANALAYLTCIPLTLLIFYIENDRLGSLLGFLLLLFASIYIGSALLEKCTKKGLIIFILSILLSIVISLSSYKKNTEWLSLINDVRVAVENVHINYAWQNVNTKLEDRPLNQYGEITFNSTYIRTSWALIGGQLVVENPLGYGLLSLSFGELAKERWPESELSWSHSAWIDFTLGYGIPGFFLLFTSLILALQNSRKVSSPWSLIGLLALPTLSVVFLVKEISSEVFINALIFLLVFSTTLAANQNTVVERNPPKD